MCLTNRIATVIVSAAMLNASSELLHANQIIDISSAFNFDAINTQEEIDQANTHVGVDHRVFDIFTPVGGGEFYDGQNGEFLSQFNQWGWTPATVANPGGLPATVVTPYGSYSISPGSTPVNVSAEQATGNAVAVGTDRGKTTSAEEGFASHMMSLPASSQGFYSDINLLMTGQQIDNGKKRAWVRVVAHYDDATSDTVWNSPQAWLWTDTNPDDGITADTPVGGGIPSAMGVEFGGAGNLDQAYLDAFNSVEVVAVGGQRTNGVGGADNRSTSISNTANALYMHDIAGGIPVDPTKLLVGIEVQVDNGPNEWWAGFPEGENVRIYAASGTLVPEPASIALIGLGGLLLLRRRA